MRSDLYLGIYYSGLARVRQRSSWVTGNWVRSIELKVSHVCGNEQRRHGENSDWQAIANRLGMVAPLALQ